MVCSVVTFCLIYAVSRWTHAVAVLTALFGALLVLEGVGAGAVALAKQLGLRRGVGRWRGKHLLPTLGFSAGLGLMGLASTFAYESDRIVVAAFVGASAIVVYELALRPHNGIRLINGLIGSVLISTSSRLVAQDRATRLRELVLVGSLDEIVLTAPLVVLVFLLAHPILEAWVGHGYGRYAAYVRIFISYWFFAACTGTLASAILGIGYIRKFVWLSVAGAVLNLGLSIGRDGSVGHGRRDLGHRHLLLRGLADLGALCAAPCRDLQGSVRTRGTGPGLCAGRRMGHPSHRARSRAPVRVVWWGWGSSARLRSPRSGWRFCRCCEHAGGVCWSMTAWSPLPARLAHNVECPRVPSMNLAGKTALVTAGSRGLGAEIARQLAVAGANVALTYASNDQAAAAFVGELDADGYHALAIQEQTLATLRGRTMSCVRFAHVSMAWTCWCAMPRSGAPGTPLIDMTEDDWDDAVDTSLKSAFNHIHAAGPGFVSQEYGKIVCIGSINGLRGRLGDCRL